MATLTITTEANIDTITGRQGTDAYNINGTSAALIIDEDSRYGLNSTPYSGAMAAITPSATLGGSLFIDARNVRLIPFNSGTGQVPVNNVTVTQGSASGKLIGVYSALNAAPLIPGATMPTTGWIKVKGWNGTAYSSGALTIGSTPTTQVIPTAISDFEGTLAPSDMTVTAGTATIANSTIQFQSGAKSLRIAPTAATTVAVQTAAGNRARVPAGMSLTVTGYGRGTDTKTQSLSIDWYDSSMNFLSTSLVQSQSVTLNTWVTFTNSVTAPANTAYMGINIGVTSPTSGQFYYWDNITATYTGFSTGASATGPDVAGWIEVVGTEGTLTLFSGPNQTYSADGSFAKGDWYEIGTTDGNRATTYQIPTNGAASYHGGVLVDAEVATNITAASWSGGVATFTSTAHGLADFAGEESGKVRVFIDGISPRAYRTCAEATIIDANTFSVPMPTDPGTYTSGGTVAPVEWYPTVNILNTAVGTEARGKVCWLDSATGILRFGNDGTTSTGGYIPPSGLKVRIPNIFTSAQATGGANPHVNAVPNNAVSSRCRFYGGNTGPVVATHLAGVWSPSVFQTSRKVDIRDSVFLNMLQITTNFEECTLENVCIGHEVGSTYSVNALSISSHTYGIVVKDCVFTLDVTGATRRIINSSSSNDLTLIRCKTIGLGDRGSATSGIYLNVGSGATITDTMMINSGQIILTSQFSDVTIRKTRLWGSLVGRVPLANPVKTIELTNVSRNYLIDGITVDQPAPFNMHRDYFATFASGCADIKIRNVGTYASPIQSGETVTNNLSWTRSGTTCTVTKTNHGYITNDRFVVTAINDGAGVYAGAVASPGQKFITVIDANTFTFTCSNTGATSGKLDGYVAGFALGAFSFANNSNVEFQNIHLRGFDNNSTMIDGSNTANNVSFKNVTFNSYGWNNSAANDRQNNDEIIMGSEMKPYMYTAAGTATFGNHYQDFFTKPVGTPGTTNYVTSCTWTRSSALITVYSPNHGLEFYDTIWVNNSSATAPAPNGQKIVAVIPIDKDYFYFTGVNSGATSGTLDYRVMGDSFVTINMTEKTTTSASLVTTSGGAKFTGAGSLVAQAVNDQVIWEMPDYLINYTGFAKVIPYIYGTNVTTEANAQAFGLYYDLNTGSGFSGTYKNMRYHRAGGGGSSGSTTVTMTSTTGVGVGDVVFGTGIANNATVVSVDSGTNITVSTNNTGTVSGTLTFSKLGTETIPSTGFKLRTKLVTNTANAGAIFNIVIPMLSDATSRAELYPIVENTVNITVTGIASGYRIQVYNVTQDTEIDNTTTSGTSYSYVVTDEAEQDDIIRIRLTKADKLEIQQNAVFSSTAGVTILAEPEDDDVYDAYGVDGSALTAYAWDSANEEIEINESGSTWSAKDLYAWYKYYITTATGIDEVFGRMEAKDAGNIELGDVKLDNLDSNSLAPEDDIRVYRSDDTWIVRNPTTGGGDLGVYSTGTIYVKNINTATNVITGDISDVPTVSEIANAVQTELNDDFAAIPTASENADAVWSDTATYSAGTKGDTQDKTKLTNFLVSDGLS